MLANENNTIDDCLKNILDLINVQDITNSNLILESLSSIHHDKLRYGEIKTEFLIKNAFDEDSHLEDKID